MTVSTPLAILATLSVDKDKKPQISLQKRDRKGNIDSHIKTYKFHLDANGHPSLESRDINRMLSTLSMRRIHHHNQPQIIDIINLALTSAGYIRLQNQVLCTAALLTSEDACSYDISLEDLAHRNAIAQSLIENALQDSETSCRVYQSLYGDYIRHIRKDVFNENDEISSSWEDTLTPTEAQIIKEDINTASLPTDWTEQEAQALWLLYSSGQTPKYLAGLMARPEAEICAVCDLFIAQPRTAD